MPRAKKPTQDVGPSSEKIKTPSKKTSKQLAMYDDIKFETEEAWLVYKNDTSGRATSRVAYVEIVKEFYANIHDNLDSPEHPQYQRVYMRGQTILCYYGLDNMETDIFQAANTNLHEVIISICQGIDHWPDGSSTLDYKSLLPQVRTLDKMVSANLLPTTHTSTVTMERALLLHWLQTKTLNISNYIFCNVWHIRNNRRCLAFPSLITGLCALHDIDLSHEITTVKRIMQID
ncbi:putative S-locus lectin protein kinase family protein [Abeliophyllum distichum]|uniref:S-locus lectin protein kinase family protein n=1 Tax=Abeliophyllum distichum TaxID=126358 RepID=A0ABD1TZN1_9LAMI